jgi:hypothetical protein
MWSCKFAIELKYVRFNNKRNIELTDMKQFVKLTLTLTHTKKKDMMINEIKSALDLSTFNINEIK